MIPLLATDFDGTAANLRGRPRFAPELLAWLRRAQAQGATWVVLSGRELNCDFTHKLSLLRGGPLPDFLVTVEREIQVKHNGWYRPDPDWNVRCRSAHDALFEEHLDLFRDLRRWLRARTNARVYSNKWSPLNIRAADLCEADAIHRALLRRFEPGHGLTIARNTSFLRVSHDQFTKGAALSEITRQLGVRKRDVFAAGDHYNDLTMLDGRFAGRIAAPANAIPEVKALVAKVGGYIARQSCGLGLLEALQFFDREGRAASALVKPEPRPRPAVPPGLREGLPPAGRKGTAISLRS